MMFWLLIGCYTVLGILLLNLNLRSQWSWPVKAAAIVITSITYYFTYQSFTDLQGYPVDETLPERFEVQWVLIDEPDKVSNTEGQIYLWVRELNKLKQPVGQPRVFKQSFDEALAERTQEAKSMIEGGERVIGFIEVIDSADADDRADADNQRTPSGDGRLDRTIQFKAVGNVDLPPKSAATGP